MFDSSHSYSLSVKQTCAGAPLSKSAYGFWFWAVDIYGGEGPLTIKSVNFQ